MCRRLAVLLALVPPVRRGRWRDPATGQRPIAGTRVAVGDLRSVPAHEYGLTPRHGRGCAPEGVYARRLAWWRSAMWRAGCSRSITGMSDHPSRRWRRHRSPEMTWGRGRGGAARGTPHAGVRGRAVMPRGAHRAPSCCRCAAEVLRRSTLPGARAGPGFAPADRVRPAGARGDSGGESLPRHADLRCRGSRA